MLISLTLMEHFKKKMVNTQIKKKKKTKHFKNWISNMKRQVTESLIKEEIYKRNM